MTTSEKPSKLGPFKPTLIIHGGSGAIHRANLPPEVWVRYQASLLKYLTVTKELLDSGASALDAACHAVTLFEDDVLFNCGRGSVFTERGTIEMEASVMVCSVDPAGPPAGGIKRTAAVSMIRNTRHPILLAKEVLVTADEDAGLGVTSTLHCHLSGRDVEVWGWTEKALEKKPDRWFWTQQRWDEHRRGLKKVDDSYTFADLVASVDPLLKQSQQDGDGLGGVKGTPSQGTVGAVCLDSWGNLAVATSTGGLTNKKPGRIGDTPTVGAGYWAEAWNEYTYNDYRSDLSQPEQASEQTALAILRTMPVMNQLWTQASSMLGSCLNSAEANTHFPQSQAETAPPAYTIMPVTSYHAYQSPALLSPPYASRHRPVRQRHHALAISGTGNGDSFLRTDACRTAASLCRLDRPPLRLADAVGLVAGPLGLLQRSAGDRWGKTFEGQGGMIGIEVVDETELESVQGYGGQGKGVCPRSKQKRGQVVFDFNCGGLFRAYYEIDEKTGEEKPKIMVFKEEY